MTTEQNIKDGHRYLKAIHKGSANYGYSTKWCTAMLERPEHFLQYKKDGELYRFINFFNLLNTFIKQQVFQYFRLLY